MTTGGTCSVTGGVQVNSPLDLDRIRADFPILQEKIHGHRLVYLDNVNTTQKPKCVLDALNRYYTSENANIHRAVHLLSVRATEGYERSRQISQRFINAARPEEVVFVRGTTEAINLVAQSYARPRLQPGDEIIISTIEHHSNIVPWQLVCEQTGAVLRVIPINDDGEVLLDEYERLLGPKTRMVALTYVSNSIGTVNPVHQMIEVAHAHGAPVLIDAAQAIPHFPVDVRALDCEFLAFSGHKVFGPTGIGVLYGKYDLLNEMVPYQGGGEMIRTVTFEKTTYNDVPHKFEAGTPNIAGAIGQGEALNYVSQLGLENIHAYEDMLLKHATEGLCSIEQVRMIGTAKDKAAILSFIVDGIHPHDLGTILDQQGIAVRTGHHCAQPVMERFGVPATVRASFAIYNTIEDADALVNGVRNVIKVFG